MRIQPSKVRRVILKLLLKQQKTNPSAGSPSSARVNFWAAIAPAGSIDLVGVRQIDDVLREAGTVLARHERRVGDEVVHIRRAHAPREAKVVHLDGRWAMRQQSAAVPRRIAVEVDEDVDIQFRDSARGLSIAKRTDVDEVFELAGGVLSGRPGGVPALTTRQRSRSDVLWC